MRLRPLNEGMDGVIMCLSRDGERCSSSSWLVYATGPSSSSKYPSNSKSLSARRPEARQYIVAGSRGRTVSIDEQP